MEYRRNTEDLKQAIRDHTIHGYPLKVPIFKTALGIKTSSLRELVAVIVEPIDKMSFDTLAAAQEWGTTKQDLKHWIDYAASERMPHAETEPLRWMHPNSRVILEEGYKVSEADIRKEWLRASGHLDAKDKIKSYSFDINQVTIDPKELSTGMIVEFREAESHGNAVVGRVIGTTKDPQDGSIVVFLETFQPVPALLAPGAQAPWLMDPSFIPDKTWVIGYGTLRAMKKKGLEIPSGMFDPNDPEKKVYFLDQPIPLSVIRDFCRQYYPTEDKCIWQSMVYMVIPLHPAADSQGRHHGGIFRPYPDDTRTTEIEAEIDYFGEGIEFEE